MRDGEKRVMRKILLNLPFEVVAYRVDSETPYVLLKELPDAPGISLTDSQTIELIARLKRALNILPSSK